MITVPIARSASAMSRLSLLRSGRRTVDGPSASAASSSARLVIDLEPGTSTTASIGVAVVGAGQGCVMHR